LNLVWSFFLLLSVLISVSYPVYPEGRSLTGQFEASPQYHLRIAQGKLSPDQTPGLGTQEAPRADGGKDTIYYSTVTPEEEKIKQEEEKEKQDKSWDALKNIIIDKRRTR